MFSDELKQFLLFVQPDNFTNMNYLLLYVISEQFILFVLLKTFNFIYLNDVINQLDKTKKYRTSE